MSHSLSPTNRNLIFGWVKNLKRGSLMSNDSVNEIPSDNDLLSTELRSPSKPSHAVNFLGNPGGAQQNSIPFPISTTSNPHYLTLPTFANNYLSLSYLSNQPDSNNPHHIVAQAGAAGGNQDFLRPMLHHKLRSSNNVSRVRSNSLSQLEKLASIRQHRDLFLQHNLLVDENSKYFGVPLEDAIREALAKISILNPNALDPGESYGEIPIVVAKCGVYLKNNGLTVEGIFRVGGLLKRLKELQVIFNSPPDYGKKLNWDGYNVHDAALILRRYLNALPEPLIPLDMYESFRDPLRTRTRIINYMKYKAENPSKSLKTHVNESTADTAPTTALSDQNPLGTDAHELEDGKQGSSAVSPGDPLDAIQAQPLTEANIDRFNNSSPSNPSNSLFNHRPSISPGPSLQNVGRSVDEAKAEAAAKKSAKKSKNYKKLTRDVHEAIEAYKQMVTELPTLSKQLLFYILDLLAMVQNHLDQNLMSLRNLAAIFQPSILSHPNHDMDPEEYALSQLVVEFLIQYAYKLLPKQTVPSSEQQVTATEVDTRPLEAEDLNEGKAAVSASNATSTSTTPIETEAGDILQKPPLAPFKRNHSNSHLTSANHDDLVGFKPKASPMSESDNEYEITDEDNVSDIEEYNYGNPSFNQPIEKTNPQVEIIVSTPSSNSVPRGQ